jgi:hypothetical protein
VVAFQPDRPRRASARSVSGQSRRANTERRLGERHQGAGSGDAIVTPPVVEGAAPVLGSDQDLFS